MQTLSNTLRTFVGSILVVAAALDASAQQHEQDSARAPRPFDIFVYDALGATPKLDWLWAEPTRPEAATSGSGSDPTARADAAAAATFGGRLHQPAENAVSGSGRPSAHRARSRAGGR